MDDLFTFQENQRLRALLVAAGWHQEERAGRHTPSRTVWVDPRGRSYPEYEALARAREEAQRATLRQPGRPADLPGALAEAPAQAGLLPGAPGAPGQGDG